MCTLDEEYLSADYTDYAEQPGRKQTALWLPAEPNVYRKPVEPRPALQRSAMFPSMGRESDSLRGSEEESFPTHLFYKH
jgi:hypothetical protein